MTDPAADTTDASSQPAPKSPDSSSDASLQPRHVPPTLRHIAIWVLIVVGLFGADIFLKYWSFNYVPETPIKLVPPVEVTDVPNGIYQPVIPYVLELRLLLNPGAVFGIAKGQRWIFIVISFVAIGAIGCMFYLTTAKQWLTRIALAAILAGALGNLYDRLIYGMVRDMLYLFPDVHLPGSITWPNGETLLYPWIFNLADVFLVCGIIFLLIQSILTPDPKKQKENAQTISESN